MSGSRGWPSRAMASSAADEPERTQAPENPTTPNPGKRRILGDACCPPAPRAPAVATGRPALRPVTPVRSRRGHVHDRIRGVLHPDRRPVRCPGRARPDRRRRRGLPGRAADGQAGRPLRAEEDVGGQRGRPGRDVLRVAVHHRLPGIPPHGRRDGGHRRPRWRRPRRLHDRRTAGRRAREVPRVHVLGAQRRLHPRLPARWHCAGVRLQHAPARAPLVHGGGVPRQRRGHQPAAAGLPRRAHAGRAQDQGRRARTDAQPGLAAHDVLHRGLLDQPGAAQHRDPAVAGGGDRRSARAAGPSSSGPTR